MCNFLLESLGAMLENIECDLLMKRLFVQCFLLHLGPADYIGKTIQTVVTRISLPFVNIATKTRRRNYTIIKQLLLS